MRVGGTIEASLVAAARAGDRRAADDLDAASLPQALHGDPDVDDVVQDVMLRALRQLPALRKPESFRSWLTAIAVNQISTHLHRRTAHAERIAQLDDATAVPDPGADIEDLTMLQLELSAQRRQVVRAGYRLDPDDRVLLSLWLLETTGELTRADLAAALGSTVAHAGVRIQRMRQQLDLSRDLVVALDARPRCAGLAAAAADWDGTPAPLWRKPTGPDLGGFSFQAPNGRYLRHASWRVRLDRDQGTSLFRGDATFCIGKGATAGTVTLESSNYPGWYVHHRERELWVDQTDGSAAFRTETSFRLRPALAN